MGSLLVRATFGERVAGILVWQRGKRSSENRFQTTFGLAGKGSSLEDCVRTAHTLQTGFVELQVGCVPKGTHVVGCRLQVASFICLLSFKFHINTC